MNRSTPRLWLLAFLIGGRPAPAAVPAPVLVELFTSEGCSSCPPADELLLELGRSPGVIVLEEHVDYWDRLGWKDPFGSGAFSRRQQDYAGRFGLGSIYTPQAVVDGSRELVGSDRGRLLRAVAEASAKAKLPVALQAGSPGPGGIPVTVEIPAPGSAGDVVLAVAEGPLESRVGRGENAGRLLRHGAVVRKWIGLGRAVPGKAFRASFQVGLEAGWIPSHLSFVAFIQEPGNGRVLGAASAAPSL